MSTSFDEIIQSPPSGRRTPLIVDHEPFGRAIVLQGGDVPWGDVTRLLGYLSQVHGLFDPDAVFIDGLHVIGANLVARPDLIEAMAARTRAGYALKVLLGDEEMGARIAELISTVGEATRRRVAFQLPSPAILLALAHSWAHTPLEEVTAESADSASVYIAEWLGRFAGPPVAVVLLDARSHAHGDTRLPAEHLEDYTAVRNMADHLRLTLAWRERTRIRTGDGSVGAVVADEFWQGEEAPSGVFLLACVPGDRMPEEVLARVRALT